MLTALIMAGGKGTRFWPISTEEKPKQFLKLINDKTMLQMTVERLLGILDYEHIFVCTSEKYFHFVNEQIPNLPLQNIIIEPLGRNTAPCILLSTFYIKQIYENVNILVLPSDHIINDNNEFLLTISDADKYIVHNNEAIITLGIEADRPETGYGYIKNEGEVAKINHHQIKKVEKFVEKPNLELATYYINEKNYLWNAGMFLFNSQFMLEEFSKYYSDAYNLLLSLPKYNADNYMDVLKNIYPKCEPISIDYAIMEKSQYIYVIPSNFGWDDIGSWNAIERYIEKDSKNNIIKGSAVTFNSHANLIYSTDKKVVLLDIKEIFCIETENVVVIGNKSSLNKVHELKEKC